MTEMTLYRWFWPWQDDREEAWLEGMALQGWQLKKPQLFGRYVFTQAFPKAIHYRLDFKETQGDYKNYLQIFTDAGWEYLGAMGGWQYFCKPAIPGAEGEIFSDSSSKIEKYFRYKTFLTILAAAFLPMATAASSDYGSISFFLAFGIYTAFLIFVIFVMIKLDRRIKALRAFSG